MLNLDWSAFFECLMVLIVCGFGIFLILLINAGILEEINAKRKKNKVTVWQYLINVALIIFFIFAVFCGIKYLNTTAIRHPDIHYHNTTHNYSDDCDGSITCDNDIITLEEIDSDLTTDWVVKFEDGTGAASIDLNCDDVKKCVKEALE